MQGRVNDWNLLLKHSINTEHFMSTIIEVFNRNSAFISGGFSTPQRECMLRGEQ